jgi:fibronectin-binding autotransporter adhesin
VAVTIEDGALLSTAARAVDIKNGSTIHLLGSAQVTTTGNYHAALYSAHDNNSIDLNGTSNITTNGVGSYGISVTNNSLVTLNDAASVTTRNIAVTATIGNTIKLNGTSSISTTNGNSVAVLLGVNNTLSLHGSSAIHTAGAGAYGVRLEEGNAILLNDDSLIQTTNTNAHAISIRNGGLNTIVMNSTGKLKTYGANADGIYAYQGQNNNSISLNDASRIVTTGSNANGIRLKSDRNTVQLTGTAQINTSGLSAYGAYLIGISNHLVLNGDARIDTTGGLGRGIVAAGDGDTIQLNGRSKVTTSGSTAAGIVLKTNPNQVVELNDDSKIITTGPTSAGIEVQSASATVTLNDSASITTSQLLSYGIRLTGGRDVLTLNDSATIRTTLENGVQVDSGANDVNMTGRSSIISDGASRSGLLFLGDDNTLRMSDTSSVIANGAGARAVDLIGDSNDVNVLGPAIIRATGANGTALEVFGDSNNVAVGDAGAMIEGTGSGSHAVTFDNGSNSLISLGTIRTVDATAILGDNHAANRDTVINFGTISSGGGAKPISLLAGDDTLGLGTGSHIDGGDIDGGAGNDRLILFGSGSEDNQFINFESLIVAFGFFSDAPDWSLTGNSTFTTGVDIVNGRLGVNGTLTSPATTVEDGGVLGGNGTLVSNVTSTGHIAPGNSVGTLTINGNFTQTGGAFDVEAGSGGVDRLNVLGAAGATLAGGPVLNVIPTGGSTGGAGIILHANNGITGTFGSVNFQGNGAATIIQTATDISLIAVDGTPAISGDFAASEAGLDYLDSVGDEQIAGLAHCGYDQCARLDDSQKHLWMKAFGHFGNEAAGGGDRAFDYTIAGTAMGGDMHVTKDLSLGVSAGYSNTDETVSQHAATADINTGQLGLYANWQHGPFFVTGLLSGGWQSLDLSRNVGGGEADASTTGWLFGSSLQAGAQFSFPKGWRLTPSAGIAYQHQWIEGYAEHGAGAADVSIKGHQADALRLKAQLELANDIELTGYTLTPHLTIGVQQQENLGGHATGAFSNGDGFTLNLKDDSRTIGTIGLGMEVGFQNGLSTYVNYDAALASGRTVQAVTGGLRYSW